MTDETKGKKGIDDRELESVSGAGEAEDDVDVRERGRDRTRTGAPPTRPAGGVQHPEKDYTPGDSQKKKLSW
jgi:hypothetical protein